MIHSKPFPFLVIKVSTSFTLCVIFTKV